MKWVTLTFTRWVMSEPTVTENIPGRSRAGPGRGMARGPVADRGDRVPVGRADPGDTLGAHEFGERLAGHDFTVGAQSTRDPRRTVDAVRAL